MRVLLLTLGLCAWAQAQPYTYTGTLQDASGAAPDAVDLRFQFADAAGEAVGVPVEFPGYGDFGPDGGFTVQLDPGVLSAPPSQLFISVDGESLPPQQINSVPRAQFADSVVGPDGVAIDVADLAARVAALENQTFSGAVVVRAEGAAEGEFSTLPEAVAFLATRRVRPGAQARIELLPGRHELAEPLVLDHPDGQRIDLVAPAGAFVNALETASPAIAVRSRWGAIGGFVLDGPRAAGTQATGLAIERHGSATLAAGLEIAGFQDGLVVREQAHVVGEPPMALGNRRCDRPLQAPAAGGIVVRESRGACVRVDAAVARFEGLRVEGCGAFGVEVRDRGVFSAEALYVDGETGVQAVAGGSVWLAGARVQARDAAMKAEAASVLRASDVAVVAEGTGLVARDQSFLEVAQGCVQARTGAFSQGSTVRTRELDIRAEEMGALNSANGAMDLLATRVTTDRDGVHAFAGAVIFVEDGRSIDTPNECIRAGQGAEVISPADACVNCDRGGNCVCGLSAAAGVDSFIPANGVCW